MNVRFTEDGWADYQHWVVRDRAVLQKVNALIEDARRNRFTGIGKPEALRGDLTGWWSRRITGEHRLVYRIEVRAGVDQHMTVSACRYHYTA